MSTQTVTIIEPDSMEITVPAKVAARVIRAWFCTKGTPENILKITRDAGLKDWYTYATDDEISIGYRAIPGIETGEPFDYYARRVARFVNNRAGFFYDDWQVRLFATVND